MKISFFAMPLLAVVSVATDLKTLPSKHANQLAQLDSDLYSSYMGWEDQGYRPFDYAQTSSHKTEPLSKWRQKIDKENKKMATWQKYADEELAAVEKTTGSKQTFHKFQAKGWLDLIGMSKNNIKKYEEMDLRAKQPATTITDETTTTTTVDVTESEETRINREKRIQAE